MLIYAHKHLYSLFIDSLAKSFTHILNVVHDIVYAFPLYISPLPPPPESSRV